MTFWEKSLLIFKYFCDHGTQSVRRIAQHTGLSKSSVHRLRQAMMRREGHPASGLWETEHGRQWLIRLVIATLYIFGLKRGVGLETISEFFVRLRLERHLGCSPTALRRVMQTIETTILETARTWTQEGRASGEVREIIGAVDETFLERMMLVFADLPTGYLVFEEIADDRTYATWKARVDEQLAALGTRVWYLVSDRAQALIQLAEHGLGCRSIPDFFPLMHEIVKSSSLTLARHVRDAHKALQSAEAALVRQAGHAQTEQNRATAMAMVETTRHNVEHWKAVQNTYRHHLETLSFALHPFSIVDSTPQTSAQVESQLQGAVHAIETFVHHHQLPTRPATLKKVRKQLPALAVLVDLWWESVRRDVAHAALSPRWRQWAHECLLPLVYWAYQVTRTRCTRRKAKMRQALEAVRVQCDQHPLTHCLPPEACTEWRMWATQRVQAFQRASSAVEGRNGYLAQLHHNQRGLPKQRYKVWTALHNFDGRAADGTTPASRFFQCVFPDLFETVVSHMQGLPQPRQRKRPRALTD
jgi:Family of unknown function (DUF6399)/IclR helix-turn-helix domain